MHILKFINKQAQNVVLLKWYMILATQNSLSLTFSSDVQVRICLLSTLGTHQLLGLKKKHALYNAKNKKCCAAVQLYAQYHQSPFLNAQRWKVSASVSCSKMSILQT